MHNASSGSYQSICLIKVNIKTNNNNNKKKKKKKDQLHK